MAAITNRSTPGHASEGSAKGAKDRFLAAMSHELRTPLNAIIGFAEVMKAEIYGPMSVPQYKDYVDDIAQSGRFLLKMIEDVLEISRAEAGELVLNKREVALPTLIDDAVQTVVHQLRAKNITVSVSIADQPVIQVDPDKARRLLACLLSNAIKFSPDGSTVGVQARLDHDGLVTICIADRGVGMDPAVIERAFEPFVQLDDQLSRQFEGAGLGLPLARRLAEAHGGHIDLRSAPGKGTTASVQLPAYWANRSPTKKPRRSAPIAFGRTQA